MNEIAKSDWKLFQSKIGEWLETYMDKLGKRYIKLLLSAKSASVKFWNLDKRMRRDKKKPGVQLDLIKSETYWNIARLIQDKAIAIDDLSDFSDDLKNAVSAILER